MKFSIWDLLALLVLLLIAAVVLIFVQIFFNPSVALNPFPPPTQPVMYAFPTNTATLLSLPPTWTPGINVVQQDTQTIYPSSTAQPSNTPLLMNTFTATSTPTDTPTATSTSTRTATITKTPTITLSPTITLTRTQTPDYEATNLSKFATDAALTQQAGGDEP